MEHTVTIVEGWTCEQTQFMNIAEQNGVEVYMESDRVQVEVQQGSGYMSQHTSAYIPMAIIVRMMEHAGYTVTPPVQVVAEQV